MHMHVSVTARHEKTFANVLGVVWQLLNGLVLDNSMLEWLRGSYDIVQNEI